MTATRRAQLLALRPYLRPSLRWQPLPVAALGSLLLLAWQHGGMASPEHAVWMLRAVAVLLAAAVAFGLDDPSLGTLAASPTPLVWRVAVRIGAVLVVPAGVWAIAVAWAEGRARGGVPGGELTLEAAAVAVLGLAAAASLSRWRQATEPGVLVLPLLAALALALPQVEGRLALAVLPGPAWHAAHARWAALLVVALVVIAASVRDPAAPALRRPVRA